MRNLDVVDNGAHDPRTEAVRRKFPGDELVDPGLADLRRGIESVNSLLVAAAAPRLRRVGVAVPEHSQDASGRRLYAMLDAEYGNGAHSRYNSLQRRIIAYCAAKAQDARRH